MTNREKLYALLDHLKEYANAVSADLETGSHWMNNIESEKFAKRHSSQTKWAEKMATLTNEVADAFGMDV